MKIYPGKACSGCSSWFRFLVIVHRDMSNFAPPPPTICRNLVWNLPFVFRTALETNNLTVLQEGTGTSKEHLKRFLYHLYWIQGSTVRICLSKVAKCIQDKLNCNCSSGLRINTYDENARENKHGCELIWEVKFILASFPFLFKLISMLLINSPPSHIWGYNKLLIETCSSNSANWTTNWAILLQERKATK